MINENRLKLRIIFIISELEVFDEEPRWYQLGGVNNTIKLKTEVKISQLTTSNNLKLARENINLIKWQFEPTNVFPTAKPRFAKSTKKVCS